MTNNMIETWLIKMLHFRKHNVRKLIYMHLQFLNFFTGLYPGLPLKQEGIGIEEGRRDRDGWGGDGGEEGIR
jgi:hypothetical protein